MSQNISSNSIWSRLSNRVNRVIRPVINRLPQFTSTQKRFRFIREFFPVEQSLSGRGRPNRAARRFWLTARNPGIATNTAQAQRHATIVSQIGSSQLIDLPADFVADKGKRLYFLIQYCLKEKIKNVKAKTIAIADSRIFKDTDYDLLRVTGLELWNYVQKYKGDQKNPAYAFKKYSQKSFRVISNKYLSVALPPQSLAKCLSEYGSTRSTQHKAFLNEVGLDELNVVDWLYEALKDRTFLNIHSFETYGNSNFRIAYHIPVTASSNCKFKKSLVSLKVVIEYSLILDIDLNGNIIDGIGSYDNQGKLVTVYVQNNKFRLDDVENLRNICPGTKFWGNSKIAVNKMLTKMTHGLGAVTYNQYFPLLKTERIPNQESDANRIEDFCRNNSVKLHKSEKTKIAILCQDPAYQDYYTKTFGQQSEEIHDKLEEFYAPFLAETPEAENEGGESSN